MGNSLRNKHKGSFIQSVHYASLKDINRILLKGDTIWTQKQVRFVDMYICIFLDSLKPFCFNSGLVKQFIKKSEDGYITIDGFSIPFFETQAFDYVGKITEHDREVNNTQNGLWRDIKNTLMSPSLIDWKLVTTYISIEEIKLWWLVTRNVSKADITHYLSLVNSGLEKKKVCDAHEVYKKQQAEVDYHYSNYVQAKDKLKALQKKFKHQGITLYG